MSIARPTNVANTVGQSAQEAIARAKALALRVLADRLEHGENVPEMAAFFSVPA